MKITTDDLQPVSRGEFRCEIKKLNKRMDGLEKRMDGLEKRMGGLVTKIEFEARFRELEEKIYTKQDHEKYMVWLDEAMKELRDTREERVLSERHILRLDDQATNHETRIRRLESPIK